MEHRLRAVERTLLGIGLLGVYAAARLRGEVLSRWALTQFKDDQIAAERRGSRKCTESLHRQASLSYPKQTKAQDPISQIHNY
jgi:hypothetical protein